MTGRELILYILQHNLEDEPIVKDGKLVGFLTEKETAAKLFVGEATVHTWVAMGVMKSVTIGDTTLIPDIYE